ncbi:hypothetical protein BZA05DRAFT_386092 [Tricharina praecox]|uniref:uncharacterized protein n=1 Tax=Tricharina praecox TaxID=43433 RepID=UPI002220168A|nr:uncharacterized protein BZA05DRAFT_386092 [Tricharina praecox]KAI5858135.1 hypothetical protein BZA05DRAFT_386092 [Tricharina praecox]
MNDRDESRDAQIAGALRKAVADAFRKDPESVTLRTVRNEVAEELKLGEGFFKSDPYWKDKSKEIVLQEGDIQNANMEAPPPKTSPEKKKRVAKAPAAKKATAKKVTAKKPAPKKEDISEPEPDVGGAEDEDEDEEDIAPKPRKRGRPTKTAAEKKPVAKSRARVKKVVKGEDEEKEEEKEKEVEVTERHSTPNVEPKDEDDDSVLSDLPDDFLDEPEPPKKKLKKSIVQSPSSKATKASPKAAKAAKAEIVDSENEEASALKAEQNGESAGGESGDESEMSVVLDETPKKKARGRKAVAASGDTKKKGKAAAAKPKKATKAKAKASGKESSPDEEQIKTLQGWLVKCGIRKMWSRELAKCDTPKEKIQHLRQMLSDAGMSGHYSLAKATKIKARRELEDEVAGVQAGVSDWNNTNDGMVTTRSGRTSISSPSTGRRLVQRSRGLEGLEFLDGQSDSD